MENGPLHDDKLFRAVNDRLSNYEAPYEGADWDAMSRALDQLPKTTRYSFRWKISLNSVLVVAGILGISVLGYALVAGGKSKTADKNIPAVQSIIQNTNVNNAVNVIPTRTVNLATSDPYLQQHTSPLQNMIVSNATTTVDQNMANTAQDASLLRRKKKDQNADGFLFGDQIDRRKGFIYQTQESASLINAHTDSVPSTYYDVVDGHIKKIHLNVDSSGHKKPFFTKDSTQTANSSAAPTDGEQHGFDFH